MELEKKVEGDGVEPGDRRSDQRSSPRFAADAEAELVVVGHGLSLNCRVLDLSLRGCRLHTGRKIPAGVRIPVEVIFSVNKIPFRLPGIIRRSTGEDQVGIEFAAMSARRTAEWAGVVEEVREALAAAAEAEKAQAEREAAAGLGKDSAAAGAAADVTEKRAVLKYKPGDERRRTSRFECKGVAEARVLPLGSKRPGTLLDLSAGGCCIETRDPFPAAENPCWVEVTLKLRGFNLRLAGVVRRLYEKNRAGIEFTDVSEHKAAEIVELVAELDEMAKTPPAAS